MRAAPPTAKLLVLFGVASVGLLSAPHDLMAGLSRDSITEITANLYGLYTTSDPLCQSELVATIPLSSTPRTFDMVGSPAMGNGPVATPVRCVVMVLKNSLQMGWKAGSYTSTTSGNSDAVCNSGGTVATKICGNGGVTTVTWPTQILTDMAATGLTATTSCPNPPSGNEVVAVFLSTYAKCTGNATLDAGTVGCVSGNNSVNNTFAYPTGPYDSGAGISINESPASGSYTLVIDPDLSFGNDGGGACASVAPPRFSFR